MIFAPGRLACIQTVPQVESKFLPFKRCNKLVHKLVSREGLFDMSYAHLKSIDAQLLNAALL